MSGASNIQIESSHMRAQFWRTNDRGESSVCVWARAGGAPVHSQDTGSAGCGGVMSDLPTGEALVRSRPRWTLTVSTPLGTLLVWKLWAVKDWNLTARTVGNWNHLCFGRSAALPLSLVVGWRTGCAAIRSLFGTHSPRLADPDPLIPDLIRRGP